ncbi:DUF4179 domain-containing protein [Paenibacillus sp. FSL W8-0426]|uniref:DUF4179 domain-containing protein n=1 Tax=Paenibacillus sp. FSL W8-0426 TaxID=2921714 RepID=UPI0030DA0816
MTDENKTFEALERRLHARKAEYDAIPVPDEIAHLAVQSGIRKATRNRKSRLRWGLSGLSAACIILLFTGCIRVSPAFASFVEQLPGMEGIVNLIRQDKGLQLAVDQSLLQTVNITDEHDGISVTVNGVITDDARMVIFYTMKGVSNREGGLYDIQLQDEHGEGLSVGMSYESPRQTGSTDTYEGYIDAFMSEEAVKPDKITIQFQSRDTAQPGTWSVTFPVDYSLTKGMKKTIPIHQTATIDGQRIEFGEAVLYPTRLKLDVKFDPDNSKEIFGLRNLQLVDEQGRAWRTNLATSSGDERSIFFESMYFAIPKKLTLQGSGLSALDKTDLDVTIDLKTGRLEGGPKGLTFADSEVKGRDRVLEFHLSHFQNGVSPLTFSTAADEQGKHYVIPNTSWEAPDQGEAAAWYTIENGASIKGKLTLRIGSYPMESSSPFSLDIPLE